MQPNSHHRNSRMTIWILEFHCWESDSHETHYVLNNDLSLNPMGNQKTASKKEVEFPVKDPE